MTKDSNDIYDGKWRDDTSFEWSKKLYSYNKTIFYVRKSGSATISLNEHYGPNYRYNQRFVQIVNYNLGCNYLELVFFFLRYQYIQFSN